MQFASIYVARAELFDLHMKCYVRLKANAAYHPGDNTAQETQRWKHDAVGMLFRDQPLPHGVRVGN